MATEKGQALIELAVGMFVLVLVISALVAISGYIVAGLKAQNSVRSSAVSSGKAVEVDDFAAEWFFGGVKTFDVSEKAVMPPREILR
jgi:hypothetical protein